MRYRGIEYDIKVGIGIKQWIWIVHTPKPRQGVAKGTRERAVIAARKAIDEWCARNPAECEEGTSAA